jgi:hypothetical protein
MPAPPLTNTFEGGTDTTTISAANSGGASGDAFQAVTSDTSGPTFSVDHAHTGLLSAKIATAVSPAVVFTQWTGLGTITADVWWRGYFWFPSQPAATFKFCRLHTAAGATCGFLALNNASKIIGLNAAQGNLTVGTVNVTYGQWVRLEMRVRAATSNGQLEWRLFNSPESTSADDTKSDTTAVLGSDVDRMQWGATASTLPASYTFYYDDLAVSTTDWIGPLVTGTTHDANIEWLHF